MEPTQKEQLKTEGSQENELVDQTVGLFELIFQYFETLAVYYRKSFNQKLDKYVKFFFTSFALLFLLCSGLSMLIYAVFNYLLVHFQNNYVLTSLVFGLFLVIFPIVTFLILIKKTRF